MEAAIKDDKKLQGRPLWSMARITTAGKAGRRSIFKQLKQRPKLEAKPTKKKEKEIEL